MLHTTLNQLKLNGACGQKVGDNEGYDKLHKHIGYGYPKNKPIDLTTILASNGSDDTLWSLRAVLPEEQEAMSKLAWAFIADCIEGKDGNAIANYEKQHPKDKTLRRAIEAIREFVAGKLTIEELRIALDSARATTVAYAYYTVYNAAYYAAAYAYAYAAAYAYSYAAASYANASEKEWQAERLKGYLDGGVI